MVNNMNSASPFDLVETNKKRITDDRGYLEILYEKNEVTLKRSFSRAGVFRGMHWQQAPHKQTKLIRVVSGRILDFVAKIDHEPYTLSYQEFSASDGWIMINEDLAHGFYAFEDTVFEYLCHGAYNETSELSFSISEFLKAELGFTKIIVSQKDSIAPRLNMTR